MDWDAAALVGQIRGWGQELGFQAVGITDTDLRVAEVDLAQWLCAGFHGEMHYMSRHARLRTRCAELVPGTVRVISARMNYLPAEARASEAVLAAASRAYISRYALGRDYHRVLRGRLQQLAEKVAGVAGNFGYRVFTDSAPVMEVELARKAGLGWRGKHTLLLDRQAGSWFFLGEIYTALPLPVDAPRSEHCGDCRRCLDLCPTGAIVAPHRLDARRCISYLTIEHAGSIPEPLRPLMGNRVYGCDDCQLACPWNRFAKPSGLDDFRVRHGLDDASLLELFGWDEASFLARMAGSAIRRIGHDRWLRNLAVGLGNAPADPEIQVALRARLDHPSEVVREHVRWALERQAHRPN